MDGNHIWEQTYQNGFPGTDVKEYTIEGKLVKNTVSIPIDPVDSIAQKGEYILKIRLSDKSKNVQFYLGELTEGKFMK